MSVCCECRVLSVSAMGRSVVRRSHAKDMCLSVIAKPQQSGCLGPLQLSIHEKHRLNVCEYIRFAKVMTVQRPYC
jgi:hypothetical protein